MSDGPIFDRFDLPVPPVDRRRLTSGNGRECEHQDIELRILVGSLLGIGRTAEAFGISRSMVSSWLDGRCQIAVRHISLLAELARAQGDRLHALAVRLETVDRPVLEDRRRILTRRKRENFRSRFGYYPEENQVLKRQRPPHSGSAE